MLSPKAGLSPETQRRASIRQPFQGAASIDYSPFLTPAFDPREYANRIIHSGGADDDSEAGPSSTAAKIVELSPTTARARLGQDAWLRAAPAPEPFAGIGAGSGKVEGDVGAALGRLNFGIDEVDAQIKSEVIEHAPAFLARASNLSHLMEDVTKVREGIDELDSGVDRLRSKVHTPYVKLLQLQRQLSNLHEAGELVRIASRFVTLGRRLEAQMMGVTGMVSPAETKSKSGLQTVSEEADATTAVEEQGRSLARAALSIAELTTLVDHVSAMDKSGRADLPGQTANHAPDAQPLTSLQFVRDYLPALEDARSVVVGMMEDMVIRGLQLLSPTLLSVSLQTAYNLGHLPSFVQLLLDDLTSVVRERIQAAFDMATLARELGMREPHSTSYKPRRGAETSQQAGSQQAWANALWKRLETLIVGEMGAVCSKIYTLERVLALKHDTETGEIFLTNTMKILGDKPSLIFWKSFGQAFEDSSRTAAQASSFVQQTLSNNYTRLLRLFHDFFAKTSVYTHATYTQTNQSPETILTLRSLRHFESVYLSRARLRITDTFKPALPAGGKSALPRRETGNNLGRVLVNELDGARFDPLLSRGLAEIVRNTVGEFVDLVRTSLLADDSCYVLHATETTRSQAVNADLANATHSLKKTLESLDEEHKQNGVGPVSEAQKLVINLYNDGIVQPLLSNVRHELCFPLGRMHHSDFGKEADDAVMGSGASAYMGEVSDRLWFIREQLFSRYAVGSDRRRWAIDIARQLLRTFLLHASIVRPLSQSGKLRFTSDMTELEFGISQLLSDAGSTPQEPTALSLTDCGQDFDALRSFRLLLFRDTQKLADDDLLRSASGLSPLCVLHHIVVRSPLQLPHELRGWQRVEYVKWVEAHTEEEGLESARGVVERWRADNEGADQVDTENGESFCTLIEAWLDKQ